MIDDFWKPVPIVYAEAEPLTPEMIERVIAVESETLGEQVAREKKQWQAMIDFFLAHHDVPGETRRDKIRWLNKQLMRE